MYNSFFFSILILSIKLAIFLPYVIFLFTDLNNHTSILHFSTIIRIANGMFIQTFYNHSIFVGIKHAIFLLFYLTKFKTLTSIHSQCTRKLHGRFIFQKYLFISIISKQKLISKFSHTNVVKCFLQNKLKFIKCLILNKENNNFFQIFIKATFPYLNLGIYLDSDLGMVDDIAKLWKVIQVTRFWTNVERLEICHIKFIILSQYAIM